MAAFIAATVSLEVGLLIWPFANMLALFGTPAWLKAYLLVPALGLLATSLAAFAWMILDTLIRGRAARRAVERLEREARASSHKRGNERA